METQSISNVTGQNEPYEFKVRANTQEKWSVFMIAMHVYDEVTSLG